MTNKFAFLYSLNKQPMFEIGHANVYTPNAGSSGWYVARCSESGLRVPVYIDISSIREYDHSGFFLDRLALLNKLPKIGVKVWYDRSWSYDEFMES